jgi:hypothetical protein
VSRREVLIGALFAAGALALLAIAVAILVLRPGPAVTAPPSRPLTVTTDVSPRATGFGDAVTAAATVIVDTRRVDPASVQLQPDFAPYAPAGDATRSSSRSGPVAVVEFRFPLSCFTAACLPGNGTRRIRLPAVAVHARLRDGSSTRIPASWPEVALSPRVDAQALTGVPPWREQLALPGPSYRARPRLLLALVLGAAAALALAAAAIVTFELVRRRRRQRERTHALSRLALALALARESTARDPEDRRKALALLARVLPAEDDEAARLAAAATELAWARPRPDADRIDALAAQVEQEVSTP